MPPRKIASIFYAALGEVLEYLARRAMAAAGALASGAAWARNRARGARLGGRRAVVIALCVALGIAIGALAVLAERWLPAVDKIARCEAAHTAVERHRDWVRSAR